MARPLRIEFEGGWYHVISRGIERREIFRDDADRMDFLGRLFALSESHGVEVHGYCLMENHFHLQLRTLRGNLKAAMQRLLSGYVVRFNRRYRRVGPLFQGRYKAIMAGENEWITEVSRYIHLNPARLERFGLGKERQAQVRRGVAEPSESEMVKTRLEALRNFRWSSYRAYAGYQKPSGTLQTGEVLACFEGAGEGQRRRALREFVEEPIREGQQGDGVLERVRYGALLGSEEWMGKMRRLIKGDGREQPQLERLHREEIGFDQIAVAVAEEFGEPWTELMNRRGNPARDMAIVLSRRHTALGLKQVGEHCGGMDYSAVLQACSRMRKKIALEPPLQRTLKRIEARFQK